MKSQLRGALVKGAMAGVIAAGVGLVAMPSSPALAVGCTNSGCNGKDPQSNGCSSTASHVTNSGHYLSAPDFYVEMRKSSGCQARWARVTIDTDTYEGYTTIQIQHEIETPYGWSVVTGDTHTKTLAGFATGQFWTAMAPDNAQDKFRVCGGLGKTPSDWCSDWLS